VTPRDQDGNPIPDEDVNNKMFVVVRNTKSAQNNLVSFELIFKFVNFAFDYSRITSSVEGTSSSLAESSST